MTNDTSTTQRFTVYMHARLDEELDREFDLFEGYNRERLYDELPRLHPAELDKKSRRRLSKRPRVFRGQFDSSNVGFTYVQTGDRLHVVEFWFDSKLLFGRRSRVPVDVVIGTLPKPGRRS